MIIHANINSVEMTFETGGAAFSPLRVDRGTLAMLGAADFSLAGKLLDLGCGYGVVGIYAAKLIGDENVVMSDIDEACVELARHNARANGVGGAKVVKSDGFRDMHDTGFSLILSNPPYQADFAVPKHFIEKGFNRLAMGGRMMMVTKRKLWYKNKLAAIFGGVRITEVDGYYVFCAEKRGTQYANAKANGKANGKAKSKANINANAKTSANAKAGASAKANAKTKK